MKNKSQCVRIILLFFCVISFSAGILSCSRSGPASLSFIIQPQDASPRGTTNGILNSIQVQLLDSAGNLFTDPVAVTISIANQPNSGFYKGLLAGSTTVNSVNGIASFNDLNLSQIGSGYTLKASIDGVTPILSEAFNITNSTEGFNPTNRAGFEIAYIGGIGSDYQGYVLVYVDQEPNPIDQSAFDTYSNPGYITNSPRYAAFNFANTLGSPNAVPGPMTPYIDPSGYTWGYVAQVQSYNWPFNASDYPDVVPPPVSGWQVGQTTTTVPEGAVKYTNNNKNQQMLYTALDPDTQAPILRYFITDEWGNVFILKSANNANNTPELLAASVEAADLPLGWTKSSAYLSQDFFLNPIDGATSNAQFLEFRDNADNAYTQISWGSAGDSIAEQIGSPMPLWAGSAGARVNGTSGNDSMYGSDGDDQFYPDTGDDSIDGGGGNNGVYLSGSVTQYTITNSSGFVIVKGPDGTKTLSEIQYVQWADRRVSF